MPIMRDIKMTLAAAITASAISTSAMAQDANVDQVAGADRQDNPVVQLAYNNAKSDSGNYIKASSKSSVDNDIPKSKIRFRISKIKGKLYEITPELVKLFAAKGAIKMPKAREEDAVPFYRTGDKASKGFIDILDKDLWNGKSGVIIGVVVDDRPSSPFNDSRDHFREVHKKIVELMKSSKSNGKKTKGFAELYGAEVRAIIPILQNKDQPYEVGGEYEGIPLRVNDILIAINDHKFSLVYKKDGSKEFRLLNTIFELEHTLRYRLSNDQHLYSNSEYHANEAKIELAASEKYGSDHVYVMSDDEYDESISKKKGQHGGSSSAGGSGKGDSTMPDVASVLSQ